jgi:Fur family ferric uptake transcriptional regulator
MGKAEIQDANDLHLLGFSCKSIAKENITAMPAPLRDTRQRRAIRAVLESSTRPLTAADIHAAAVRTLPKLSEVTVYRVLHAFEAESLVNVVTVPGETAHYEMSREHHHHFFCRLCRRVFDIPCDGHRRTPVRAPLFQIEEHQVVLLGRCMECAA